MLATHSLFKNSKTLNYLPPFNSFEKFIEKLAQKYEEKEAVVFEDVDKNTSYSISYKELERLTDNLAQTLINKFGLKKRECFSFGLINTPEIILLNFAAWRAGLITVPLDPKRDTLERKIYKLKLTNSKLLFTNGSLKTKKENLQIKKKLPELTILTSESYNEFKKNIVKEEKRNSPTKASLSDLTSDCLILFTSGTTANPKGVRLNLTSLFANAESVADWLRFDESERFYIFLPLHHINATTFANATFVSGGTLILSSRYSKSKFFSIMAKHKATGSSIVPTIAYDLLSEAGSFEKHKKNLRQVKRIQIGSAPVQPLVVEKFMEKFKIPLYQGYGQTETSLRSTGVPMDLNKKQFEQVRKINSVGGELKYTNVTVLNEKGKESKENEPGEICVRGPVVMNGYLRDEKTTKEAFLHSWLHSGDIGYFRKIYGRKFFFLTGRIKEIIKKGGYLISPPAIENTLLENYPELEMVYAVGFPDARVGEEIGIVAISKNAEVLENILEDGKLGKIKGLPKYDSPKSYVVIKKSQLPKTSTGKIQRTKLKELYAASLLIKSRTIFETKNHLFRLIGPEENKVLKNTVKINNSRWKIKSSFKEFRLRAKNGILIGAFDFKGNLLGTLSAFRTSKKKLDTIGKKNHRVNTWAGITGDGTLSTHNNKGNVLICISITTKSGSTSSFFEPSEKKKKLTKEGLVDYLKSDKDSVINFHKKPKGGQNQGAEIVKVIENSRPEDKEALGYNILMQYPTSKKLPELNINSSIGSQLIEAALNFAYQKNLDYIYVYTRPSDLSQFFTK